MSAVPHTANIQDFACDQAQMTAWSKSKSAASDWLQTLHTSPADEHDSNLAPSIQTGGAYARGGWQAAQRTPDQSVKL